jgi:hypothetical protein
VAPIYSGDIGQVEFEIFDDRFARAAQNANFVLAHRTPLHWEYSLCPLAACLHIQASEGSGLPVLWILLEHQKPFCLAKTSKQRNRCAHCPETTPLAIDT